MFLGFELILFMLKLVSNSTIILPGMNTIVFQPRVIKSVQICGVTYLKYFLLCVTLNDM
jgi:hypothetical protein